MAVEAKKVTYIHLGLVVFALIVVVVGAYTRLTDSGLGCPDWPGCYGKLTPNTITTIDSADLFKAWTEMFHRYIAGILFVAVIVLTGYSYLKSPKLASYKFGIFICLLLSMQALLGMWTVTLKLYPIVVMAHLLGGMSILACLYLWYLGTSFNIKPKAIAFAYTKQTLILAWVVAIALAIQIFLGGWVSANYAALACPDFPTCHNLWLPKFDIPKAFDLFGTGIMESPGTALEHPARVTIHVFHRIVALLVASLTIWLGVTLLKLKNYKSGLMLLLLLLVQLLLGILNVVWQLPLAVATMHNLFAALLVLKMVSLIYFITIKVKRA